MGQNMVLFIGAIMSVDHHCMKQQRLMANGWAKFRYVYSSKYQNNYCIEYDSFNHRFLFSIRTTICYKGGAFGTGTYFVIMNKPGT